MHKSHKIIFITCLAIGVAVLGTVGIVALRVYVVGFIRIPQNGMYPTIPAGSYALTRKSPYRDVSEVEAGDIVVFTKQVDGNIYKYIWRVIGLPGDQVEVSGESVKINGKELQHILVRKDGRASIYTEINGAASYEIAYEVRDDEKEAPVVNLKVPENQLFVLGDNRLNALDSTSHGPIPFDSVIEKVVWD
jgi:signal peptidase I